MSALGRGAARRCRRQVLDPVDRGCGVAPSASPEARALGATGCATPHGAERAQGSKTQTHHTRCAPGLLARRGDLLSVWPCTPRACGMGSHSERAEERLLKAYNFVCLLPVVPIAHPRRATRSPPAMCRPRRRGPQSPVSGGGAANSSRAQSCDLRRVCVVLPGAVPPPLGFKPRTPRRPRCLGLRQGPTAQRASAAVHVAGPVA